MNATYVKVANIRRDGELVQQIFFLKSEDEFPGYVATVLRGYEGTEWTVQVIDMIEGGICEDLW